MTPPDPRAPLRGAAAAAARILAKGVQPVRAAPDRRMGLSDAVGLRPIASVVRGGASALPLAIAAGAFLCVLWGVSRIGVWPFVLAAWACACALVWALRDRIVWSRLALLRRPPGAPPAPPPP